jgi:hypothetical protein
MNGLIFINDIFSHYCRQELKEHFGGGGGGGSEINMQKMNGTKLLSKFKITMSQLIQKVYFMLPYFIA